MKELYVVNCCRTAIGSFGGSLKNTPAVDMGAIVVKEALKRANVAPENVDELMFGCILTAGQGQNPARQAAVKAYESDAFQTFVEQKTFVPMGISGQEANDWAKSTSYINSWMLYDMGFTTTSPETFGWPHP